MNERESERSVSGVQIEGVLCGPHVNCCLKAVTLVLSHLLSVSVGE